jgi:hypothetical protein
VWKAAVSRIMHDIILSLKSNAALSAAAVV